MSFTSTDSVADLPPTIGVDFKIKHVTVGGKRIKLTTWDTEIASGQEKYRTLTSSCYRNAQGIVLTYDVTRRETFANLSDLWAKEVLANPFCVKMLVGNKVDEESRRLVTQGEGVALAEVLESLFIECSFENSGKCGQCFEELISKTMEFPSLIEEGSNAINKNHI